MTVSSTRHDLVIIGGGMAGLSAALHLAERGLRPLLLEADPNHIGGRLAGKGTLEVNGWTFPLEHGAHGLWSSYVNLKAMLTRHSLLPELIPAREELWIYRQRNAIHRAPIGSALRHSIFPPPLHYFQLFLRPEFLWTIGLRDWASLLHVWSVLIMAVGVDPFVEDQALAGLWLGRTLQNWGPAIRALFVGLTRNGMSTHPSEVPLAGFLAFLRFYTLMRRKAWEFDYLPEGGGALCNALAEKVIALGGEIQRGRRVIRLEQDGDWRVHWESDSASGVEAAPIILLATDSPAAATIIKKSFPAESTTLFFPQGMANAIIRLWFARVPRLGPEAGIFSGDFVMHNFFWLDRIYAPYKNWRAATHGSCLEVHVYGPPEILDQPDALLLTQVIAEFYRAYPELRGYLITQHLQRNAATHTLPALGPRGAHLGIETPWENLYCAGDWVRHPTPAFFLERACVTGLEAANAILKKLNREPFTVEPYPAPEPFAAWIEKLMKRGRARRKTRKEQKLIP